MRIAVSRDIASKSRNAHARIWHELHCTLVNLFRITFSSTKFSIHTGIRTKFSTKFSTRRTHVQSKRDRCREPKNHQSAGESVSSSSQRENIVRYATDELSPEEQAIPY
jgi:hypothetical protein